MEQFSVSERKKESTSDNEAVVTDELYEMEMRERLLKEKAQSGQQDSEMEEIDESEIEKMNERCWRKCRRCRRFKNVRCKNCVNKRALVND